MRMLSAVIAMVVIAMLGAGCPGTIAITTDLGAPEDASVEPDASEPDASEPEDATVEAEDATAEPEDASLEDATILVSGPTAWVDPSASWGRPCSERDPCSSLPEALALEPSLILIYPGEIGGPLARDWATSGVRIATLGRVVVHSDLSACVRRAEGVAVEDVELEGIECHGLGAPGQQPCIDWRGAPGARGLALRRVTCLGYPSAVEAPGVPGVTLEDVTLGGLVIDGGSPPTDAGARPDAVSPDGTSSPDSSEAPVDAGSDRPYSPRLLEPPLPPLGGDA